MKQQVWIINSSLLLLFILTLIVSMIVQQTPPLFIEKKPYIEEREPRIPLSTESIENIYKYDLFGTFAKKEIIPSLKSLVTPIPQPQPVKIPLPPEPPKPTFLPPLKLSLQGIAFSSNEEKSICMIIDETKKETIYHIGDTIKDAQLIKIGKNRITLLRANGQHETIFLRKEDNKELLPPEKKWDDVVKKINDTTFEIDFKQFPKEIPTLGMLTEMLSLLTSYQQGKPTGIKIASLTPNSIGNILGLQKSDVITSINGIQTADKKNRIKIYDAITKTKMGDSIKISFQREEKKITNTYKLTKIEKIKEKEFAPPTEKKEKTKTDETLFKLNKLQEQEKQRRDFAKKHNFRQQHAIEEIRKRLLENIQSRVRNARIR